MPSDLWTLVPAAGESRRFALAGYRAPKPLLRVRDRHGRTMRMVEHVLERLPREHVLVAIPEGNHPNGDACFVHLEPTRGQAETLHLMMLRVPDDARVLVCDCDVVPDSRDVERVIRDADAVSQSVLVVRDQDPNKSRLFDFPFWSICHEKPARCDSGWGVLGVRVFSSARRLRLALATAMTMDHAAYLSAAMTIVGNGSAVEAIYPWEDWGTPEAVRASGAEIVP